MRLILNRRGRSLVLRLAQGRGLGYSLYRILEQPIKFTQDGNRYFLHINVDLPEIYAEKKYIKAFVPYIKDHYEEKVLDLCS